MTGNARPSVCPTEKLVLFHYAELDEVERLQVERHLDQCPACHAELAELQQVLSLVPTEVPELSAAELKDFSARVMHRVSRPQLAWRPALGWGLAGLLVLLLTFNLQPQVQDSAPAPVSVAAQISSEQEVLNQLELLQDLDLLENLDLLQQLASQG
jgi:anti-sigma factor RsiW